MKARSLELGGGTRLSHVDGKGIARFPILCAVAMATVSLGAAVWLMMGTPGTGGIWTYRATDRGAGETICFGVCLVIVVGLVRSSFRPRGLRFGPVPQMLAMLAFYVGANCLERGPTVWTKNLQPKGGHGTFLPAAAQVRDVRSFLEHYDELNARRQLGPYAPSKPPGTLLYYMANDRVARVPIVRRWLRPVSSRLDELAPPYAPRGTLLPPSLRPAGALLVVGLPIFAFLACALVWASVRRATGDGRSARWAAWWIALSPGPALITVHLDATLFHFVSALVLFFSVQAAKSRHGAPWAVAAGITSIGAAFMSYGLLPLIGLGLVVSTLLVFDDAADRRLGRTVGLAALQISGFMLGAAVLIAACHWRPLTQYRIAYAYHLAWMGNDWAWRTWRPVAEFAMYGGCLAVGLLVVETAVAIAALWRNGRSLAFGLGWRSWRAEGDLGLTVFPVCLFALFAYLTLARGTGECGRLWQYLVPWVGFAIGRTHRFVPSMDAQKRIALAAAFALVLTKAFGPM